MCLHKLFDKHLGKEKLGKKIYLCVFRWENKNCFQVGETFALFSCIFELTWYKIHCQKMLKLVMHYCLNVIVKKFYH